VPSLLFRVYKLALVASGTRVFQLERKLTMHRFRNIFQIAIQICVCKNLFSPAQIIYVMNVYTKVFHIN
jgi:hypothetical protein